MAPQAKAHTMSPCRYEFGSSFRALSNAIPNFFLTSSAPLTPHNMTLKRPETSSKRVFCSLAVYCTVMEIKFLPLRGTVAQMCLLVYTKQWIKGTNKVFLFWGDENAQRIVSKHLNNRRCSDVARAFFVF